MFDLFLRICDGGVTNLVSAARSGGVSRSDCRHAMKIKTPYELKALIYYKGEGDIISALWYLVQNLPPPPYIKYELLIRRAS